MTNEEALKIIKSLRFDDDDVAIALQYAIKALEKQIPKKVIWKFGGDGLPYVHCGVCGKSILRSDYCDNCGQRLDWRDENDTVSM